MNVMIVVGSARASGSGSRVGSLVATLAKEYSDLQAELVSVGELDLPPFDEDFSPKYRHYYNKDYTNPAGKAWAERVAAADAFIIITPEYNHSTSGSLKNALDWVGTEWDGKPVGLVGYSITPFGGVRAVEHLLQISHELGLRPTQAYALIGDVTNAVQEDGSADEQTQKAIKAILQEITQSK